MDGFLWAPSKSTAVTPHDTDKLKDNEAAGTPAVVCRGISVTVGGLIAYKDKQNVARIAGPFAANVIHPLVAEVIMATGTTATGIRIYW